MGRGTWGCTRTQRKENKLDYLSTHIGAVILAKVSKVPLVLMTIIAYILGEGAHYVFQEREETGSIVSA